MDNQKLIDDCTAAMTLALLEVIGPCLRNEEKADAAEEFARVCKAGLESFIIQRNRELARFEPSRN